MRQFRWVLEKFFSFPRRGSSDCGSSALGDRQLVNSSQRVALVTLVSVRGMGEDGKTGNGGGGGVEGRGVLGQSPFDPAQERTQAQVAASVQVQVRFSSRRQPRAILEKAMSTSDKA